MVRVVGGLTTINVVTAATGFVTGPLQARALGPAGRGDLAAILVPLNLLPPLLSLALGAYACRELARGGQIGALASAMGSVLIGIGVIGAVGGIFLADFLANGRESVELLLTIGFLLMPLSLLGILTTSMLAGLERWRLVFATRLVPAAASLLGIGTLYVLDALTVVSAALVTLVGGLLSIVPSLCVLRGVRIAAPQLSVIREGVVFGAKTWLSGVASLANARLDQFLMIRLVDPRELGLYAVAVTVASIPGFVIGALGPPLFTRIAKGDYNIIARAHRTALGVVSLCVLLVGLATPSLVPFAFGDDFEGSVTMTLVLLGAAIPLAGVLVLSTALVADGRPGIPSIGEGLALVVTVIGLVCLLSPLGGLGAALTSLAAYAGSFCFQLIFVRRYFGGTYASYLVPTRDDVRWAWRLIRGNAGSGSTSSR